MLTITDGGSLLRALKLSIDLRLKQLLIERRDQLCGDIASEACFVIVQPGDSLQTLAAELGFSVFTNHVDGSQFCEPDFSPSWEWLADHGHCFEMVFIFDDRGFAHILLVENSQGFVEHYNHERYHESLNNVTPADAYFGGAETIIKQRERIKRQTIKHRRLQHRKLAA